MTPHPLTELQNELWLANNRSGVFESALAARNEEVATLTAHSLHQFNKMHEMKADIVALSEENEDLLNENAAAMEVNATLTLTNEAIRGSTKGWADAATYWEKWGREKEAESEALADENEAIMGENAALREKNTTLHARNASLQIGESNEVKKLQGYLDTLTGDLDSVKDERDTLHEENENLEEQLFEVRASNTMNADRAYNNQKRINTLVGEACDLEITNADLNRQLKMYKEAWFRAAYGGKFSPR